MPNRPMPKEVAVEPRTTALLVLDLNARCENPEERCHQLVDPVARFLRRAREQNIFIVYPAPARKRGTGKERIPPPFERRPDEPVLFPPAFDKFYSGELQPLLKARGIKTVIV